MNTLHALRFKFEQNPSTLLGNKHVSPSVADKIVSALKKVEHILKAHEKKFG
ncbi:hypothetical protein AKG98_4093 [Moritella sp. JT01]|nr:hypothetical protein AKG98_4093 [Moritella sp. JT01]